MKKIIYGFIIVAITLVACDKNDLSTNPAEIKVQDNTISYTSCVSMDEYENASSIEKKIINQIDGALVAMELMKRDDSSIELDAIISISSDPENGFSNYMIITKSEPSVRDNLKQDAPAESSHSCEICNVKSAYSCVKQIIKDTESLTEFDVHVERIGGCVKLSW
ncbi:MAG: hypothetical protein ACK5KP_02605 [Paludibacteraceae bacterium]